MHTSGASLSAQNSDYLIPVLLCAFTNIIRRGWFHAVTECSEPGRYKTEVYNAVGAQNKPGLMVTTTERFNDPSTATPGPGSYQVGVTMCTTFCSLRVLGCR